MENEHQAPWNDWSQVNETVNFATWKWGKAHHDSKTWSSSSLFFKWAVGFFLVVASFLRVGSPYLDFPQGPRLCWIWTKCCKLRQWLVKNLTSIEPIVFKWKAWGGRIFRSSFFYPILVPWILRTDEVFRGFFQGYLSQEREASIKKFQVFSHCAYPTGKPTESPKLEKVERVKPSVSFFQVSRAWLRGTCPESIRLRCLVWRKQDILDFGRLFLLQPNEKHLKLLNWTSVVSTDGFSLMFQPARSWGWSSISHLIGK